MLVLSLTTFALNLVSGVLLYLVVCTNELSSMNQVKRTHHIRMILS